MNAIQAHEANGLAYKTMNFGIYAGVAAAIYITEAILAVKVKNIGTVFGFVGTFAGVSISYFIPTILFNKGFDKFATVDFKIRYKKWLTISKINGAFGVFFFCLFLYANILDVTSGGGGGGH